jgi:hypothetical protein
MASDRQKRLLSVLLSISTFVIYNSKGIDLEKDLELMTIPEDLCAVGDRNLKLLWLMRDIDKELEPIPPDSFVETVVRQNKKKLKGQTSSKTQRNLEERFGQHFGYSLVHPNDEFANGPSPQKDKSG